MLSFQRPGKFNLTAHVNETPIALWGQRCGFQIERAAVPNVTKRPAIQKPWRRSFLNQGEKIGCCWSTTGGEHGEGRKRKDLRPCNQERFSMVIGKRKDKVTMLNVLSFHVGRKHGLVVASGNGGENVCARSSLWFPLRPWASLLSSLCLLPVKTGILVFYPLHRNLRWNIFFCLFVLL